MAHLHHGEHPADFEAAKLAIGANDKLVLGHCVVLGRDVARAEVVPADGFLLLAHREMHAERAAEQ